MSFKYFFKEPNKPYEIREYMGSDDDMLLSDLLETNSNELCDIQTIQVCDEDFAYYSRSSNEFHCCLNNEVNVYGNIIMFRETKSKALKLMENGVSFEKIQEMFKSGELNPDENVCYADVSEEAIKLLENAGFKEDRITGKTRSSNSLKMMYSKIFNMFSMILGLTDKKFTFDLASEMNLEINKHKTAIFLLPDSIKDITIPMIVINDNNEIMRNINDDITILGIIAHECRHIWQYYQNNSKWICEMKNPKGLSNCFDKERCREHFNSEIEMDAYAFQLAFIRVYSGVDDLNYADEIMKAVPSDFERRTNKLYNEYKGKIENVFSIIKGE